MRPWIERLARLGYVCIGVVYAIVGALTAAAALHLGGKNADRKDALAFLVDQSFGSALLLIIAAGLAGYAVWKILSAIGDTDRRGRDAKGLAIRSGSVASGLFYGALVFEVVSFAMHHAVSGRSSDASARHWTARLMDMPFGRWLVVAAGVAVAGAGVYQLTKAWRAKLGKRLNLEPLRLARRDLVVAICRFGIGARGVVFAVIGVSLVRAAVRYDPAAARGTAGAFATLARQPFGPLLLAVVAIGFIAYGAYAVVNAMYRRIDASPAAF